MMAAIPNLKLFLPFCGKVLESCKHRADHDQTSFLLFVFFFFTIASLPWGGKYPCVIESRIHEILIRTGASLLSLARVIAFQGTSWRRSVSIAPCLTTSLQSSLLCLSPTLVGMHLPTSTA